MIPEVCWQHFLLISHRAAGQLSAARRVAREVLRLGWAGWRQWLTSRHDKAASAAWGSICCSLRRRYYSSPSQVPTRTISSNGWRFSACSWAQRFGPRQELHRARAAAGWRARLVAVGVPIAVAVQVLLVATPDPSWTWSSEREVSCGIVGDRSRRRKPVISDEMVDAPTQRSSRVWEPAIFVELASTAAWDERPFVEQVRRGDFAFFVTFGSHWGYTPRGSRCNGRGLPSATPSRRLYTAPAPGRAAIEHLEPIVAVILQRGRAGTVRPIAPACHLSAEKSRPSATRNLLQFEHKLGRIVTRWSAGGGVPSLPDPLVPRCPYPDMLRSNPRCEAPGTMSNGLPASGRVVARGDMEG